jgi:hypothetical protein
VSHDNATKAPANKKCSQNAGSQRKQKFGSNESRHATFCSVVLLVSHNKTRHQAISDRLPSSLHTRLAVSFISTATKMAQGERTNHGDSGKPMASLIVVFSRIFSDCRMRCSALSPEDEMCWKEYLQPDWIRKNGHGQLKDIKIPLATNGRASDSSSQQSRTIIDQRAPSHRSQWEAIIAIPQLERRR